MLTGRGFDLLGGAKIKSVQRGTFTVSSGTTVSISPVDLSKSVLLIQAHNNSSSGLRSYPKRFSYYVDLTDTQTITFTRDDTDSVTVNWTVIEFENILVQKLTGTIPPNTQYVDLTISAIDTSKTFLITPYMRDDEYGAMAQIINSNTIRVSLNGSIADTSKPYVVFVVTLP